MKTPRSLSTWMRLTSRAIAGCLLREQSRPGILGTHRLGQLLHRLLLLLAQVLGDVDHEAVVNVTFLAATPELGRALPAQTLDGAMRGAWTDTQSLGPVQRRHLHLGSTQGLGNAQRNLHLEVVTLAGEEG